MSLRLARSAAAVITLVAVLSLAGVPTALGGQVTVRISDRLEPATVRVAPGTVVTWRNVDGDRHRMRSRTGPTAFDSGNLEPGESFTVTFREPGRYPYLDERDDDDPRYHGTVIVGDDSGAPSSASGGGAAGGSGGGSPAVTIVMRDRAFSPATLTVAAGTRITFRNDDDREHTATGQDGAFDTGVLDTGDAAAVTMSAAGTSAYLCAIHPEMTGRITVNADAAAPAPSTPPPDPVPTPVPAAPATRDQTAATVAIVDFAFSPATVEAVAGSILTVRNEGAAIHTLTASDGSIDSGFLEPGVTFRAALETPGDLAFACALHPEMRLTVRVVAPGSGASTGARSGSAGNAPAPAATEPPTARSPDLTSAAAPADSAAMGRLLLAGILVAVAGVAFAKVLGGTARPRRS